MDWSGLSKFDLATILRNKWAAVSRMPRIAAILGLKSRVSMFRKIPNEVIVLIMCHTTSSDLTRLIRTEKSMNEIFQKHKRCIFKRAQQFQFPEFLECFGDLPGFDGPIPGDHRTSEQIQCLEDVVLSFDWRRQVPTPCSGDASMVFLQLLERHGGWRYLYFLSVIKFQMEVEAQSICRILYEEIPDMTEGIAKAIVFCFSRMSWNAVIVEGGEAEQCVEIRMRVQDRLKFFRQEPLTLQELMKRTLTYLIFRIGDRLRLNVIVTGYRHWYLPAGVGNMTPMEIDADWHDVASNIMAKTLLESFFFHGITNILQLCDEATRFDIALAQAVIIRDFTRHLENHLVAAAFGTVPHVDPAILEGSLWAAGIGFPTFGWFCHEQRVEPVQ